MIPVPQAWRDAYNNGEAVAPLCQVTFTDPTTGITSTVYPTEGTITRDAGQWPRHQATFTVPGAITPELTAPPVSPYGGTVVISMGAILASGVTVWMDAATLDVTGVSIDRPSGDIVVDAASHEARVNEDRYDTVTATPAATAGALVVSAVQRTLGATWPYQNLLTADTAQAAAAWSWDGDVWPTIEQILETVNGEAYFDSAGNLVVQDRPVKATGAAAISITVGSHGQMTGYASERRWGYNRVVVVYDDGTSRMVGTWQQSTSGSPTLPGGPYGRHTYREDVSVQPGKLPILAVANRAALTRAARTANNFRRCTVRAMPAPWVEPGDTIEVGMFGLTERHLVESVTVPISGLDVMELETTDSAYTGGIT